MPTYSTPGVYIEEISTLPPSVAEVATAIPAFIGYTAKGASKSVEIAQVSTLLEYEMRFGKAKPTPFRVASVAGDDTVAPAGPSEPAWLLWYAINHYFKNGGGRCYVVSIGNHDDDGAVVAKDAFSGGLAALAAEDEPTLIVMPEAVKLDDAGFKEVCEAALMHCAELGDRFAILDVKAGDVTKFRGSVSDYLMYGAAYHPYLDTSLTHEYDEGEVKLTTDPDKSLSDIKTSQTTRYNQVKKLLATQRVRLPPSAAIAGIYARVDRDRGVWKAPANVGVMAVIGPQTQITHKQQGSLNIDPDSGKSINAIRTFAGRGTLVWGARTLAGNDNEWRFVSVRRLFIMIEESAKKATAFAVFEPNDVTTWLKVKGMLESYLYGLWEQGALQGAKPEAAFYVNVGLGKTMTPQDVLEGRLKIEIGVAAVRPAEFIILRFSHKLAEA